MSFSILFSLESGLKTKKKQKYYKQFLTYCLNFSWYIYVLQTDYSIVYIPAKKFYCYKYVVIKKDYLRMTLLESQIIKSTYM